MKFKIRDIEKDYKEYMKYPLSKYQEKEMLISFLREEKEKISKMENVTNFKCMKDITYYYIYENEKFMKMFSDNFILPHKFSKRKATLSEFEKLYKKMTVFIRNNISTSELIQAKKERKKAFNKFAEKMFKKHKIFSIEKKSERNIVLNER